MPLTQLISHIGQLSHSDKLLFLNFLTTELLNDSGLVPLNTQNQVGSQGLHDSFEAASVLSKALAEEKMVVHG